MTRLALHRILTGSILAFYATAFWLLYLLADAPYGLIAILCILAFIGVMLALINFASPKPKPRLYTLEPRTARYAEQTLQAMGGRR